MGVDMYRVKYDFVLGSLAQEELDFIDDIIYRSDDGTYELGADHFQELKQRKTEFENLYKTELDPLFRAFSREIRRGKGHFSFRAFA